MCISFYQICKVKRSARKTHYDLMRVTFPADTVSGAPKIYAMQIIADLEARLQPVGWKDSLQSV